MVVIECRKQRVTYRVSASRAHIWATCSGFFEAVYLTDRPYVEAYHNRLGNAVHELIAVHDRITEQNMVDIAELVRRNWRHGRFAKEDDARAREEAEHLLSAYAIIRANEAVHVLGNEVFCQTGRRTIGEEHAIILSGHLDRVAQRRDGTIEVLDLKTSSYLPTQAELYADPATTIYHLLPAERYNTRRIVVSQLSLRTGARVEVILDEYGVEAGKAQLREMVRQLADHVFPLTPSGSCAFCPARNTCSALLGADNTADLPL